MPEAKKQINGKKQGWALDTKGWRLEKLAVKDQDSKPKT
jgi:hypothetical protein